MTDGSTGTPDGLARTPDGLARTPDGAASPPSSDVGALERLASLLSEQGGLIATLLTGANGTRDATAKTAAARSVLAEGPAQIAAAGPRARSAPAEYELLVEAIYEGYLLHQGSPRLLDPPEADLGLLAGDRLYALGLARLVELGDVEAVAELADTISLSALAQASGDEDLADAVWGAGARAVGWGSSPEHRHAKELALAGSPEAIEAMRTSAGALAAPR